MSIEKFRLPDVGEGVAEGELVRWHVEPGDSVEEDQVVAEVETDKALVEVPSPFDGTVAECHAEPGETVPVGDVIITVDIDGEPSGDETGGERSGGKTEDRSDGDGTATGGTGGETESDAPQPGTGRPAPPRVRRLAREEGVDLATVSGSGPGGRVTEADVLTAAGSDEAPAGADGTTPRTVTVGDSESAVSRVAGASETESGPESRERTLATPATRGVARELDVDIEEVPTDERRDGEPFVTDTQVRSYAAADESGGKAVDVGGSDPTAQADDDSESAPAAAAEATDSDHAAGDRIPYRGVRRAIGERMEESKYTAPHVTHHDDLDAERLVAVREELNEVADDHLTYMPFVLKAVVGALQEFPRLNAELDAEREEIRLHEEYNVGVATATDVGLMVPVVEAVDRKGLRELAVEIGEKAARARDRSIDPSEMQCGTFTVTNVGAIGGEYATPILNHPEVGILALGAIRQRPRVVEGEVVARHTLPLSLSIDHRVVDGAVAARFTNAVIERLETPERLLL